MNKRNVFAIIMCATILALSARAYAMTYFDPPTLVVTKPTQPSSGIIPAGALHVPFTRIDLTARGTDIVVEQITVERTGPSDDAAFDEIILLDENGEELGDGSLDDEHSVQFTEPIYIPRNTTAHLTIAANMGDDLEEFAGQFASLTVTDIQASGHVPVR